MPIYEYRCDACGKTFEMIRNLSESDEGVNCPICESPKVNRVLSVFNSAQGENSSSPGTSPSCGPGPFT
jgi:putative FmdB family regulatory protein